MILFALTFVFGALGLQQQATLPNPTWIFLCIPLVFLHYFFRKNFYLRSLFIGLFGALLGFFWAAVCAQWRLSDELPKAWELKSIDLVGVVASMPEQQARGVRFLFDVEKVLTPNAIVPKRISLVLFQHVLIDAKEVSNPIAKIYHAGERWQFTVRLKRPHGTQNPYGFDFEAWALAENIRATGSIRNKSNHEKLADFVWQPHYVVERVRELIQQRIAQVLQNSPSRGVLQALVIGDDNAITRVDWDIFLRTGTNHLMSISGLHITMLAGLAFTLVRAGWRRVPSLVLRVPTRKIAVVAGVMVALLYALVAGFSVPTQRTLYMLTVFAWALWSDKQVSMARVLAIALFTVVLFDPWAVIAPGFWLSFGAVAIIAYAVSGRLYRPHWLRDAVTSQWAVTLGLTPFLLVMFQQFSIVSPIANAFAIPLISLLVVPCALLGSLLPLDFALYFAHSLVQICMMGLHWLAALPHSVWQQHAPPVWTLLPAMLGVFWILLPRGFPLRYLGWLGFLPMLFVVPIKPKSGEMDVTVLDVGQGLAVMVQTAHHQLLYDTGPQFSSQSDSGSRIIVPFLRGQGIEQLNGLMVSHNDVDHSGGMASVLAQIPVQWVASALPDTIEIPSNIEHMKCYAGQYWVWDEVIFEVLHPTLASYEDVEIKDNNRSCVLKISSAYGSLLLSGDIEKEAEAQLLENAYEKLLSDILVTPHHGSKTSSSSDFVDAVSPKSVIYTVGYLNRFKHPHALTMRKYAAINATPYRSDFSGAISISFREASLMTMNEWRKTHTKYWYDTISR